MLFWNNAYSRGLAGHMRPVTSVLRPASAPCCWLCHLSKIYRSSEGNRSKWVSFCIAIHHSSGYNPIFCPVVSADNKLMHAFQWPVRINTLNFTNICLWFITITYFAALFCRMECRLQISLFLFIVQFCLAVNKVMVDWMVTRINVYMTGHGLENLAEILTTTFKCVFSYYDSNCTGFLSQTFFPKPWPTAWTRLASQLNNKRFTVPAYYRHSGKPG